MKQNKMFSNGACIHTVYFHVMKESRISWNENTVNYQHIFYWSLIIDIVGPLWGIKLSVNQCAGHCTNEDLYGKLGMLTKLGDCIT